MTTKAALFSLMFWCKGPLPTDIILGKPPGVTATNTSGMEQRRIKQLYAHEIEGEIGCGCIVLLYSKKLQKVYVCVCVCVGGGMGGQINKWV